MKFLICWFLLWDHKFIDEWRSKPFVGDTPNEILVMHCSQCVNCGKQKWEIRE